MNPALVKKLLKPDDPYQLLEHVQNNGQKILVTIQCRRDVSCHGKSEEGGTTLMVENSLWVVTNSNRNLYSDIHPVVTLFALFTLCLLLVITL